jgi:hypothetical protein
MIKLCQWPSFKVNLPVYLFNSNLHCSGNNLKQLVLPEGFDSNYTYTIDKWVKVYTYNQWLALERERKINLILDEL